jgi:hypothetical protein
VASIVVRGDLVDDGNGVVEEALGRERTERNGRRTIRRRSDRHTLGYSWDDTHILHDLCSSASTIPRMIDDEKHDDHKASVRDTHV